MSNGSDELTELTNSIRVIREIVDEMVEGQARMVRAIEEEQKKVRQLHAVALRLLTETRLLTAVLRERGVDVPETKELEEVIRNLHV